jgi:hypothetical protein
MAIFREARYEEWLHRDITEDCEPVQGRKIPSFKNTWFGVHKTV